MKISYNWLKQYIDIEWPSEQTAELLTNLGLEVENIEKIEPVKGGLKGVIVGEILTCIKHPNADKLKLTKVNIGKGEIVQIICGAANVTKGLKVAVATIGTILYDEKDQIIKIKRTKIRGEESCGMICSEKELKLGNEQSGIIVLQNELTPGISLSNVFNIEIDEIFEIGLTPNRSDAMSHLGVARDLKAGLRQIGINKELRIPPIDQISHFETDENTSILNIEIKNPNLVRKYAGLILKNVKIDDSPIWMQNRLKSIGLKPINNVVDITNYVLHECGQPLHAFDFDKIQNKKIIVTTLKEKTKFKSLDGVERELDHEDLMICDGDEHPLCIAGILGGLETGINEETRSIFLESAYFDPISIRKTAKRYDINTDASFRFERGVDPGQTEQALMRATLLIQELCGGTASKIKMLYPNPIENTAFSIRYDKISQILGQSLSKTVIKEILSSLDIKIDSETQTELKVTIPSFRPDIKREIDLIEDILRIYGYHHIAPSKKWNFSIMPSDFKELDIENAIAEQLHSLGFNEILTSPMVKKSQNSISEAFHQKHDVQLLNPLSSKVSTLRQSLSFSGLESINYNINQKNTDIKFYEFGKTYHKSDNPDNPYLEHRHLALFVTGNKSEASWISKTEIPDFFYLKSVISLILEKINLVDFTSRNGDSPLFSEGMIFQSKQSKLVEFGILKDDVVRNFSIKQKVLFADFDWNNVLKNSKKSEIKWTELPKYPCVRRDLSLLLDSNIHFADLKETVLKMGKPLLKKIDLFDVYEGDDLPEGKKSYALSFLLQSEYKTLTDSEIQEIMTEFQMELEKKFQASIRS